MLRDARDETPGATLQADVCIAGAGAAGITLARELGKAGLSVLLLESGAFEREPDTQALYQGDMIGLKTWKLDRMRKREFGGTTAHWSGWCRPLSPEDFEARDYVANSGWPIRYDTLVPYYERACDLVEIGPFDYDSAARSERLGRPLIKATRDLETRYYQFSPPTRFGERYRQELVDSDTVTVVLHANLVDIQLATGNGAVSHLLCKTLEGVEFRAEATRYVLAMGGLENARMLLASNTQVKAGVANGNDVVGRYFMEHPHYFGGAIFVRHPDVDFRFYDYGMSDLKNKAGVAVNTQGSVALNAAARKRDGLLDMAATFYPASPETTDSGPLGHSHMHALVARNENDPSLVALAMRCEQSPRPDSRVTLGKELDALGLPRIALDWRIHPDDDAQLLRGMRTIARELVAESSGRLWISHEGGRFVWTPQPGGHHIGTTRMGTDPRSSVVDADCKCHELENLFVAGASVFTTGGDANPTLTVLALALRLAEHLTKLEAP